MTKARKNASIVFLLLIFSIVFFLIYNIHTASYIPDFEADMISFSENMAFGVTINAASCDPDDGILCSVDLNNAKKEIDAAADMGVNFVRFNLAGEILDSKEDSQKLDEAVFYARGRRLKVNLAFWGRKKWMSSRDGNGIAWEDFRKKYVEDVGLYMRRYRPDYFVVLPECPRVPGSQINSEKTLEEWLNFAKEAALSAKRSFYGSKIILEGLMFAKENAEKEESEFLNSVMRDGDPIISIISVKAENINDLEGGVKNFVRMKEKYHWQGNTWLGSVNFGSESLLFKGRNNSDGGQEQKKFLLYAFYLADANGFSGVSLGNLRDQDGNDGGIVKQDYSPKPAYDALKQVTMEDK